MPSDLELALLDRYQRDFPLDPAPFARIAEELNSDEGTVVLAYQRLKDQGYLSRIGAVVRPHRQGWSTLAAMSVPTDEIEEVAAVVNACPEVNHNYEREHDLNLWFVVTGPDRRRVHDVLDEIEMRTGYAVIGLPLEKAYRVDLGFPLGEAGS